MYLLDANAFMEANRMYYAFDIAPGFWTWLGDPSLAGQVASIDAIKDEITAGFGALVDWARARPDSFWLPDSEFVVTAMTELATWSTDPSRNYRQAAVDEFLASADLKLIAHAIASEATVVTRERSEPDSKRKIKIPDVCIAFGVDWADPFSAYGPWGCDSSPDCDLQSSSMRAQRAGMHAWHPEARPPKNRRPERCRQGSALVVGGRRGRPHPSHS